MRFEALRPLIVPSAYFAGGDFPAPHRRLAAPDLALTWVELTPGQTMLYVTPQRAATWDAAGADWRGAALTAMRSADAGRLYTHEKRTAGGALAYVAMMHEDGLGSSRLLLREELGTVFPEGYWVALPDRSCGLAVSRALTGSELEAVRAMIAAMHAGATTPMLPDLREPDGLLPHAG